MCNSLFRVLCRWQRVPSVHALVLIGTVSMRYVHIHVCICECVCVDVLVGMYKTEELYELFSVYSTNNMHVYKSTSTYTHTHTQIYKCIHAYSPCNWIHCRAKTKAKYTPSSTYVLGPHRKILCVFFLVCCFVCMLYRSANKNTH